MGRPPNLVLALLGTDLPVDTTEASWHEIYRIDRNGGKARVAVAPSPGCAQLLADHHEAKGHHQGYFVRGICVASPM